MDDTTVAVEVSPFLERVSRYSVVTSFDSDTRRLYVVNHVASHHNHHATPPSAGHKST